MIASLKILEFNQIKSQISTKTFSYKAQTLIENLHPISDLVNIKKNASQTNEVLNLIVKYGSFPFLENFDNNLIDKGNTLERIYTLDELLFLRLYFKMEIDFNNYFTNVDSNIKINNIKELITLNDHYRLNSLFSTTFTDYGEIFDDATKELKSIRTVLKKLHFDLDNRLQKLLKTYESYLTDPVIVTRNNRYCLPVKEGFKNKVKGVIHDISQSKQTVFIEPEISLQISAEIEMNKLLEAKEIQKILTNLTIQVNNNFETLEENYYKLIALDVLHAKAKYSLNINGILPRLNNEGRINFIKAKHPLLDPKIAVPISLSLNKDNNILLITGPNTGGKTVGLKTIGLLTIMIQSGILIPINEESEVAVFDNIFADIGDEQSIASSLSTFSSHLTNIISYLNNLTDNSLILLDELGSGTDPIEGVSLAISIIEEFNKKDVRLIVTSHYSELKTYAYEQEGILTASVAFDKESLKPLYYLQHGISGESHARLIAKRLGMPMTVIDKADDLYSKKETDLAKIISKLNDEKNRLDEERQVLDKLKDKYIKERNELERTKEKLLNEQTQKLEDIRVVEEAKWKKKEEEIKELIQVIELEQNVKQHQVTNLKGLVNKKVSKQDIVDEEQVISLNDQVYIKSYQQYGKVIEINKDKYRVVFGMFDLWFKKNDLKVYKDTTVKKKEETVKKRTNNINTHNVTKSGSMSLDLRGYRYEEVYEAVDKAVDQALLSNLQTITIIHGFGTGAVREAVYSYLKKSKHISSYRYGGEGEGLNGATVVTLK